MRSPVVGEPAARGPGQARQDRANRLRRPLYMSSWGSDGRCSSADDSRESSSSYARRRPPPELRRPRSPQQAAAEPAAKRRKAAAVPKAPPSKPRATRRSATAGSPTAPLPVEAAPAALVASNAASSSRPAQLAIKAWPKAALAAAASTTTLSGPSSQGCVTDLQETVQHIMTMVRVIDQALTRLGKAIEDRRPPP